MGKSLTATSSTPLPPIPYDDLVRDNNLRQLVEAETGPLDRRGFASRCPFHARDRQQTPSLHLYKEDGVERFRCFSCNAAGNVLDWVRLRDGVDVVEAARRLGWRGDAGERQSDSRPRDRPNPQTPPQIVPESVTRRPAAWQDPDWQQEVDRIVCESCETLRSPAGRVARDWLNRRGVDPETARVQFRIGFTQHELRTRPLDVLTGDDGRPRGIYVPRQSIVVPWVRPESWYSPHCLDDEDPGPRWIGLNCRRIENPLPLDRDGRPVSKTICVRGSSRGHAYPFPDLVPGVPTLIVEGEWDGLLAWQEIGHLVNVVTVGSAEQGPRPDVVRQLALSPVWLVALDGDSAGHRGTWSWFKRHPHKTRRVIIPEGQDLTDFHLAGGDLRQLVEETISPGRRSVSIPAAVDSASDLIVETPAETTQEVVETEDLSGWTEDHLQRRREVEAGRTVVANHHRDRDLVEWADRCGLAVGIMRSGRWRSSWGNPFKIGADGDRDGVVAKHAGLVLSDPEILDRTTSLRGRVLVCCCHPAACHGDILAAVANGEVETEDDPDQWVELDTLLGDLSARPLDDDEIEALDARPSVTLESYLRSVREIRSILA